MTRLATFNLIPPSSWLFQEIGLIAGRAIIANEYRKTNKSLKKAEYHIEEFIRQWIIQQLITTYEYPEDWLGELIVKGYSDLRHGHPRAMAKPKVVESTRHFHHEIADGSTPDSQRILHHPAALDTTIDMLNAHPSARQCLIGRLLFGREGAPTGLFGRLQHLDPIQRKGEKAQILEQLAVGWQGIRRIVGNPFVMHLAFKGGTQKEDG